MDPRDRPRARPAVSSCTACGAPTRPSWIRLLARRDELAFVRVACDACGSVSLAIVTDDEPGQRPDDRTVEQPDPQRHVRPRIARRTGYGEFGPADEARFAGAAPLEIDDVFAMRDLLVDFQGDLASLVDDDEPDDLLESGA